MSPGSPIPSMGTPGGKGGNNALNSKKKAREFLVRLLYVEMLGHDGSFGFIKAVVSYYLFYSLYRVIGIDELLGILVCVYWDDDAILMCYCSEFGTMCCEDQTIDSRTDHCNTRIFHIMT